MLNFFLVFFILSGAVEAKDEIPWERWRKLFHEGRQRSSDFYFSKQALDLKVEWKKSVEVFQTQVGFDTNLHPQCRFPARYELIKKYSLAKFVDSKCPDFDTWLTSLSAEGMALVFAGNYPDNPGSIFGHTFLKITSSPSSRLQYKARQHSPILDYALNYAANVDDSAGFFYAIKGLTGLYQGSFSLDPYYVKVNEYAEGEGRDIWEYHLNFTADESRFLLKHYWELRYQAEFDYYFLDDNCSFIILTLIDAVKPEWKLVDGDPWYVIPLETVKKLKKNKDAIKEIKYRPSVRKRSVDLYNSLTVKQKSNLSEVYAGKKSPQNINDADVLNTLAVHFFSQKSKYDGELNKDDERKLSNVLLRLSQLPTPKAKEAVPPLSPEHGHPIAQIKWRVGEQNGEYVDLGIAPGVHELSDAPLGYLDYSELIISDLNFRYKDDKVILRSWDVMSVALFRPASLDAKLFSWRFNFGYQDQSTQYCVLCRQVSLEGEIGLSAEMGRGVLVYSMLGLFVNSFASSTHEWATGKILDLGMIWQQEQRWRVLTRMRTYYDWHASAEERILWRPELSTSYSLNTNWEVRLDVSPSLVWGDSFKTSGEVSAGFDWRF